MAKKIKFITKAEALRRAKRHVLKRMFKQAQVRDGATAQFFPDYTRNSGNWSPKDAWVVYKNNIDFALKSSSVVLVSKRDGRILYEGSANDEG